MKNITHNTIQLCEVHFPDAPYGGFTYRILAGLNIAQPGVRVRVPFGHYFRVGFLTQCYDGHDDEKYKDIIQVVDEVPILSKDLLDLTRWMAEYYLCDWGEALAAAVPAGLKPRNVIYYRLSKTGLDEKWLGEGDTVTALLWQALFRKPISSIQIRRKYRNSEAILREFQKHNWIEVVERELQRPVMRLETHWEWTGSIDYNEAFDKLPKNAHKMRKAVDLLAENNGVLIGTWLRKNVKGLNISLKALVRREWVKVKFVPRDFHNATQLGMIETATGSAELTQAQEQIVRQLDHALHEKHGKPFLLHGVTSSGKTMVYLEAVDLALKMGKDAVMMAPEISLTPQLTGRFHRRFGNLVALTHSRMTPVERRDIWQRVRSGQARVVIGPRSAVFAPVNKLGLIIIDEEHDDSYKQTDPNPRYNGRDTAIYRAKLCGAVALIGSATPDVSSYHNAMTGRYSLLELPERYKGTKLPPVWVTQWGIGKEGTLFSRKLLSYIERRLQKNEQTILLINRRGFSTNIRCPDCGTVAECPNCDITLRYHRDGLKLECHYCGHSEPAYDLCPKCRSQRLRYSGIGTQRVERELQRHFPDVKVARMDLDTTRTKGAHQEILERFAKREFDILLGTKMVAKGHDFPGVTLVGVLAADMEWLRPDFRAAERAFRLLVQASGRAGRDSDGEVVIQSWNPTENLLRWVQQHDYRALYNSEIKSRERLSYPPFGRLIAVTVGGTDQDKVIEAAIVLRDLLVNSLQRGTILGPAPPLIERIENMFRRRILIKLPSRVDLAVKSDKQRLREVVEEIRKRYKKHNLFIVKDVDPAEV